jgi:hypothetical protein
LSTERDVDAEGVVAGLREQKHRDGERERDEEAVAHVARHVPGHVGRGHVVRHPRVLGGDRRLVLLLDWRVRQLVVHPVGRRASP